MFCVNVEQANQMTGGGPARRETAVHQRHGRPVIFGARRKVPSPCWRHAINLKSLPCLSVLD